MTRHHFVSLLIIIFVVLALNSRLLFQARRTKRGDITIGYVEHVVDGDTIRVRIDGVLETVRYIGINTPERGEPGYAEACQYNRKLVGHRRVRMEADSCDEDLYGRKLRYVWVSGWLGERFVNHELYRAGLAKIMVVAPNIKRVNEIE